MGCQRGFGQSSQFFQHEAAATRHVVRVAAEIYAPQAGGGVSGHDAFHRIYKAVLLAQAQVEA